MNPEDPLQQLAAELAAYARGLVPKNRVLVVDDEPILRELMRAALEAPDVEVLEAGSGAEAIQLLSRQEVNLLLTDKNMPGGMDGVELMKLARQAQPYLEAIMVTGFANVESALECIDLGAYDYIVKPFDDIMAVREKIRAALRRQNRTYKAAKLVDKLTKDAWVKIAALPPERQSVELKRLQAAVDVVKSPAPIANVVLVVGDVELAERTRSLGLEVLHATTPDELREKLLRRPNLVVVSQPPRTLTPGGVIRLAREADSGVEGMAYVRRATLEGALDALKAGASDCVVAGDGPEVYARKLRRALERQNQELRSRILFDQLKAMSIDLVQQ